MNCYKPLVAQLLLAHRTLRSASRIFLLTASLWMSVSSALKKFVWTSLITATVQHLRNSRTRLAKLALSYADEDHIKHVLLLSATPTPSSVCDLYVPLRMIKVSRAIIMLTCATAHVDPILSAWAPNTLSANGLNPRDGVVTVKPPD